MVIDRPITLPDQAAHVVPAQVARLKAIPQHPLHIEGIPKSGKMFLLQPGQAGQAIDNVPGLISRRRDQDCQMPLDHAGQRQLGLQYLASVHLPQVLDGFVRIGALIIAPGVKGDPVPYQEGGEFIGDDLNVINDNVVVVAVFLVSQLAVMIAAIVSPAVGDGGHAFCLFCDVDRFQMVEIIQSSVHNILICFRHRPTLL